jgi:hypothetical protein
MHGVQDLFLGYESEEIKSVSKYIYASITPEES